MGPSAERLAHEARRSRLLAALQEGDVAGTASIAFPNLSQRTADEARVFRQQGRSQKDEVEPKADKPHAARSNQPFRPSATGGGVHHSYSTFTVRSRSALPITLTDDSAIAAAATTGERSTPKKG